MEGSCFAELCRFGVLANAGQRGYFEGNMADVRIPERRTRCILLSDMMDLEVSRCERDDTPIGHKRLELPPPVRNVHAQFM